MEKKTITCMVCPNCCELVAEIEDGEVMDVTGNMCMRGMAYAQQQALKAIEDGDIEGYKKIMMDIFGKMY